MCVSPVACLNPTCKRRRKNSLSQPEFPRIHPAASSWNSVPHDFLSPFSSHTALSFTRGVGKWRKAVHSVANDGGRKDGMGGSLS